MRDLRLVTVSEDGGSLILAADDGERFALPIDDQVRAAARGHRAQLGQLQIEMEPLTPRDIQARIRAGESAEELARSAGVPLERIQRYEGPVLAERRHVADEAQGATLRRSDGGLDEPDFVTDSAPAPRLGPFVAQQLGTRGVDLGEVEWDAWRRDDGRWQVVTNFRQGNRALQAGWIYDQHGRVVVADSDFARELIKGRSAPAPKPRSRRLRSVPRATEPEPVASAVDPEPVGTTEPPEATVVARESAELPGAAAPAAATESDEPPAAPDAGASAESPPPPGSTAPPKSPRRGKRSSRPHVPSWDEIVFGAKKSE